MDSPTHSGRLRMANADGVYGYRPWMQNVPQPTNRTGSPYEQDVTDAALATVSAMDSDEIRNIRPLLPIQPFPPRFGYREEVLGIKDIASLDQIYRRIDFTGRQSGYSGSSYPSLNQF